MGTLTRFDAPGPHRLVRIAAEEDVGELRRVVRAQAAGRSGLREGAAELAATELAANIVRYGGGGHVLTRALSGGGIELIAVDRGPGLPTTVRARLARPAGTDLQAAPVPRPGSGGGLGVGLSSVRRAAATFDWFSDHDGTVILARIGADGTSGAGPWRWGGVNWPLGGAGPSGDAWALAACDEVVAAVVVDGLGHGPEAADAAHTAIAVLQRRSAAVVGNGRAAEPVVAELVSTVHDAMRGTRGGVLGACRIDASAREAVFAGVGNVTGLLHSDGAGTHLVSHPGTLGVTLGSAPRVRTAGYPWSERAVLVLASDGIDTRWSPDERPGLLRRHPAVVAAVLHRDHARGRDDATILIVERASTFEPRPEDR